MTKKQLAEALRAAQNGDEMALALPSGESVPLSPGVSTTAPGPCLLTSHARVRSLRARYGDEWRETKPSDERKHADCDGDQCARVCEAIACWWNAKREEEVDRAEGQKR